MIDPQEKTPPQPDAIQPWYVLAFVASVIAVLAVISLVFPAGGLTVPPITVGDRELTGEFTFYFPRWEDFFTPDTTQKRDFDEIMADLGADAGDTLTSGTTGDDGFRKAADMGRSLKEIQYPNDDPSILFPVFQAFEQAGQTTNPARVIHFGDSQIEGDRMTALFRAKLQERFGGNGPGLVAAKPLTSSMSVVVEYSESMQRYAQYGGVDKSVKHRRYGAMATFSRFAPIVADSLFTEGEMQTGWVSLATSHAAFAPSKTFSTLRMFYGYNRSDVNVKVFLDDALFADDNLPANKGLQVKRWKFDRTPGKIMIIMEGFDSPDIYGLSLEGKGGIAVDNISMRGSSGTSFGALERVPFKPMMDSLNPKLLLLQYGGNSVPYITDAKSAQNYGRNFKTQIDLLKSMFPGVGVIVIGPSDMSTKVEGKMQTYPNLPNVRDALRQAAFDAGAAFFDIYEAMGGQNSMISWVEAQPALAGPDYVHFTPQGARVIAEAFIKSLMADYEAYHNAKVN